jgi:hypothetical protein
MGSSRRRTGQTVTRSRADARPAAERRGSARFARRCRACSPLPSSCCNQARSQPCVTSGRVSNERKVLIHGYRLSGIYRMVSRVVAMFARRDDVLGSVLPAVALCDQVFCRRLKMIGFLAGNAVRDPNVALASTPHRGVAVMTVSALQFIGGLTQFLSTGHKTLGSHGKTPAPQEGRPGNPTARAGTGKTPAAYRQAGALYRAHGVRGRGAYSTSTGRGRASTAGLRAFCA